MFSKDWKTNNCIQKDRYHETKYLEEKSRLQTTRNGTYVMVDTPWIQDGYKMDTEVRLGKDRLGKDINNSSSDDEQPSLEQEFEAVWKDYPNKTGKKQAFSHYKAWRRKSVNNTNEYLLERLALYKQDLAINTWKRPMNGSTWFNGRFDDEYQTQQQSNAQRGSSYGGVEF